METRVQEVTRAVQEKSALVAAVFKEMEKVIVGQREMIERLLIGILADGHILVEGVPGLAKTTAVKTMAKTINTRFQ